MTRSEYDRLVARAGIAGRYAERHPAKAYLIVEVAETSIEYDRATKGPLYAACGVPEYWIVDVNARPSRSTRNQGREDTGVPAAF